MIETDRKNKQGGDRWSHPTSEFYGSTALDFTTQRKLLQKRKLSDIEMEIQNM